MDGFNALRALRRDPATKDVPIIMISGNAQATEQFYVQRIGADDFMKAVLARRGIQPDRSPARRGRHPATTPRRRTRAEAAEAALDAGPAEDSARRHRRQPQVLKSS